MNPTTRPTVPARRAGLVTLAVTALAATGLLTAPPAEAVTGTVHNTWYCSLQTGKCKLMNGPHKPWLIDDCHWTWSPIWTATTTKICERLR